MRRLIFLLAPFFLLLVQKGQAQNVVIDGYVYETNNRGYLNLVKVTVLDSKTKAIKAEAESNLEGFFTFEVPIEGDYLLKANKKIFETKELNFTTRGKKAGDKVYLKAEMERKPGYLFDVTIAEKRFKDEVVDAIVDSRIEVYNNTKKEEVLALENHPNPTFSTTFEQGNHYTVMIRKKGYFTKRMEAYVNVEGCILCFDGIGEVRPGVSDNLTAGHKMGTLLANVELTPIKLNETIKVENIYYDYNKSDIRPDAAKELDKLVVVLKDNPAVIVELGSHTDARGRDEYNQKLSQQRAQAAVDYVIDVGGIDRTRIVAIGYGETQLTNKCKNGVKCSDSDHQLNRRTELKVTGILANDPYAKMSLVDILEAESFEKMLAEVSGSDQIKIEEGQELPDEIKNQKSKITSVPKPKEKETVTTMESQVPSTNTKPPSQTTTAPPVVADTYVPKPKTERPSSAKPKTESGGGLLGMGSGSSKANKTKVEETVVATKPKIQSTPPPRPKQNTNNRPSTNPPKKNTSDGIMNPSPIVASGSNSSSNYKPGGSSFDNSKMRGEVEINTSTLMSPPKQLPRNYSGYRVEFYSSPFELPISHEIFGKHGNITVEQKKDGTYGYLLGAFRDKDNAAKFMRDILQQRYPTSNVVRYRNGNRLN